MDTVARAMQSYEKDARFRALAMSAVARAQNDFGRVDPEKADRDAHEIALRATVLLLQQVFENDAELFVARTERDRYKKLAESVLLTHPSPIVGHRLTYEDGALVSRDISAEEFYVTPE